MTTIVLADDHHLVRQGFRALLESNSEFTVIGETGDGLEALELAKQLQPDVLILDVMMPGLTGIEVARRLRRRSPQTRVIILSMYDDEAYVHEALRNGARGYVLKDSEGAELMNAVMEVSAGRYFLSPRVSTRLIEAYLNSSDKIVPDMYEMLTNREREVFHQTAQGVTMREISVRLGISLRTVETHRANLMRKLNLHSQTQLVRYALERGAVR